MSFPATSVLPGSEEIPALLAKPGSTLWRYSAPAPTSGGGSIAKLILSGG